eukprot:6491065-Amphidinium_carterae.1
MKKTLMTDGVGGFEYKICNACSPDLPALIDHHQKGLERYANRVERHADTRRTGLCQHTFPKSANDLIRHILSVMTQRLRFRICGVNSQRKGAAIKSLRQWRNEQSITVRWHQQSQH